MEQSTTASGRLIALMTVFTLGVFIADVWTPRGIAIWVPYMIPLWFNLRLPHAKASVIVAAVSSV